MLFYLLVKPQFDIMLWLVLERLNNDNTNNLITNKIRILVKQILSDLF